MCTQLLHLALSIGLTTCPKLTPNVVLLHYNLCKQLLHTAACLINSLQLALSAMLLYTLGVMVWHSWKAHLDSLILFYSL